MLQAIMATDTRVKGMDTRELEEVMDIRMEPLTRADMHTTRMKNTLSL
jgi:hypothetical protein